MRRSDREQSLEFSLELIDRCKHGTVAFATEDGAPYCIPLSLVRAGDKLYFHCAKQGHKTDLLHRDGPGVRHLCGGRRPRFCGPRHVHHLFSVRRGHRPGQRSDRAGGEGRGPAGPVPQAHPHDLGEGLEKAIEKSLSVTAVWRVSMDQVTGKAKLKK